MQVQRIPVLTAESQPFCTCTAAAAASVCPLPCLSAPHIFNFSLLCCSEYTKDWQLFNYQNSDIPTKYAYYINSSLISFVSDAAATVFIVHTWHFSEYKYFHSIRMSKHKCHLNLISHLYSGLPSNSSKPIISTSEWTVLSKWATGHLHINSNYHSGCKPKSQNALLAPK